MKQGTMNILFFILKTKLLKNGEAPILMRITIDGHYEEARIQRSVLPKQWDSAKGCSKGKDRTAKELNAYIAELSALALQKHKELMLELALITPKLLLKRVFGKETEMRTLLGTMNEEIEKMKKAVNIDYAPVTINRYINVMKKLQKAIPDFYGKEDITFHELNSDFIATFDLFLKTEAGLCRNTIVRYMKCFKRITNMALAKEWMRKDPFYGGEKTETSANAFLEAKNGTVVNPAYPALDWAFSKSATTTDGAAANPMTFYNDKVGTGYNWLASPNATLWGEAKTLNDPCPPGYRVPGTGAWEDLISGRQYIDGVSVWDGTNYGMTYTHGEQTAWYPAQGYRNYSSGAIVGLRSSTGGSGAYWSAETSSVKSYYLFFRSKLSSSGSINNELDMNRSYGYTVRCCKE